MSLYARILQHHVKIHGKKALVYGHVLGDVKYIELSTAMTTLHGCGLNDLILDIGCGHSILPTLIKSKTNIIVLDISSKALKWQINKSNKIKEGGSLYAVLASADNLPFKEKAFSGIVSISVLEHLPQDKDIKACLEIGRILRPQGECLITTSASESETIIKTSWMTGIPVFFVKIFGPVLPTIFRKLSISDRNTSYIERFYSLEDIHKRFIEPIKMSGCSFGEVSIIRRKSGFGKLIDAARKIVIPWGFLTAVEYICARTLVVDNNPERPIGFVIKSRKRLG
jgi:ubiquinone/menaquinone biosynthesis C-methylase UbiE